MDVDARSETDARAEAAAVAEAVADLLGDRRLAVAESCTGGRVAQALSGVEGAATFFSGSVVTYQEQAKRRLLNLSPGSVYRIEAAEEMAAHVRDLLGADVGLATSGVAGVDPVDGVPPGTVFFGLAVGGRVRGVVRRFQGAPPSICDQASVAALKELALALETDAD